MFVKICGITNEEDALSVVALGADAIGFVFAPSPRQVTVGTARDIVRRLPPDVLTVGVFRDQAPSAVVDVCQEVGLGGAQLHGHETPADAAEIRPRVRFLIAAFPAGDPGLAHVDDYRADAVLLDSPTPGSGRMFDWSLAEDAPIGRPVILAGGLTPENVARGIHRVRPWGVDVSSGVEVEGRPGEKDLIRVRAFIHAAREAAREATPVTAPGENGVGGDGTGPFDWAQYESPSTWGSGGREGRS